MGDDEASLQFDGLLLVGRGGEVVLERPERRSWRLHRRAGRRGRQGSSGVGIKQDVAEGGTGGGLHFEHAGLAGGVGGDSEVGEAVAVAGAAGEDEFAARGEFEQGAVCETRGGAVGRTMRRAPSCHRWLRDSLGSGNERA